LDEELILKMWDWVKDGELLDSFSSFSPREKSLLFVWAIFPIITLNSSNSSPSQTYLLATALFNVFGLTYFSIYAVI